MSGSREIPDEIAGLEQVRSSKYCKSKPPRHAPHDDKVLPSIEHAISQSGLKDGDTVSFHHHLREGDSVVNLVMQAIAHTGHKNIHLAPSSLSAVNDPLVPLMEAGVITRISTSGARAGCGEAISRGLLPYPAVFRSHGGRARAIEEGSLEIDVAFIAAPRADRMGNISGVDAPSACGSLGYAMPDAAFARCVIAVTDNLEQQPLSSISIPGHLVDFVVEVDSIGEPDKIAVGATRISSSPVDLLIAREIAHLIRQSPVYRSGFSMQFGTGGASLAVARYLSLFMKQDEVRASFILGGITSQAVEMLEQSLVHTLYDVQCFDLRAVNSLAKNAQHCEIGVSHYANPNTAGALVNFLDIVVLSAMEVDVDFNVNVLTGSDGIIRGASGGHSDTASAANLVIVAGPALRARLPLIVDRVGTVITPGEHVACVVTDQGIAWNPKFSMLAAPSAPHLMDIRDLKAKIEALSGVPEKPRFGRRIVGVVEARDGTIADVIRQTAL